jgi:hypothetical protein
LLKNGHLLRYPAASPSRRRGKKSLLIRRDATLILALLDEQMGSGERSVKAAPLNLLLEQSEFYLTGQVVAAYSQVRLTPQDFGGLASDPF